MLFDSMTGVNRAIRGITAQTLRHLPEWRGRGSVAAIVNRSFPPSPEHSKSWVKMRLHYQMLLDIRSNTEYRSYYTGDYDTDELRSLLPLIKPGWTLFDVGANIGFWTIPLAHALGGSGALHAFEPIESNFLRLKLNVRKNALEHIVTLHPFGLSDRYAELECTFDPNAETGNAAIVINDNDQGWARVGIRVMPLDDYLCRSLTTVQHIEFMKVDIEGHEDIFLAGAREAIRRFRPILYMEINEPYYFERGLDPTAVFEQWQSEVSYRCALYSRPTKWRVASVRERKPVIDTVLFIPEENSSSIMHQLCA
jgi:FkbM family methyltransferase